MEIDREIIQTMFEIGFVAIEQGEVVKAVDIFDGLLAVRPESIFPHIGCALSMVFAGEALDGYAYLKDKVLAKDPDNAEVKCYMAFALLAAKKRDQAKVLLTEIINSDAEQNWKQVAEGYLLAA